MGRSNQRTSEKLLSACCNPSGAWFLKKRPGRATQIWLRNKEQLFRKHLNAMAHSWLLHHRFLGQPRSKGLLIPIWCPRLEHLPQLVKLTNTCWLSGIVIGRKLPAGWIIDLHQLARVWGVGSVRQAIKLISTLASDSWMVGLLLRPLG